MKQFTTTIDATFLIAFTLAIVTIRYGSASYLPLLGNLPQDFEDNKIDSTSDDLTFSEGKGVRFGRRKSFNRRWAKIAKHPEPTVNAVSGQNVVLTCEVMGSPPPTVIWFKRINDAEEEIMTKSEMKVNPGDTIGWEGTATVVSKYVIECVRPEDRGLYFCAPTLGDQIFKSEYTRLKVTGNEPYRCDVLSEPVPILSYSTLLANIGTSVRLPCRSNKIHQIEWFDNLDERVVTSANKEIISDGDLLINNLQWENMGVFTCKIRSDSTSVESVSTFLYPVMKET